jgi:hypothetical protein
MKIRELLQLGRGEAVGLVLLLAISFLVRAGMSDHPIGYHGGDGYRDFMAADHLVRLHEVPVAGPFNALLPQIRNSPFYYYLIALFAAVDDSPAFVNLCFVALQCLTLLCVFYIARILFGRSAGFVAAALIAASPALISEATGFLWQPYLMEPFLAAAVLSFLIGRECRSATYLIVAEALGIMAVALHISALMAVPFLLYLVYRQAKENGGRPSVARLAIWGVAVFLALFAPTFFVSNGHSPSIVPLGFVVPTMKSLRLFWYVAFYRQLGGFSGFIAALVLVLSSALYLRLPSIGQKKKRNLVFVLVFASQVILINFALYIMSGDSHLRYFVALGWAVSALVGAFVSEFFFRSKFMWPVGALLVGAYLSHIAWTPALQGFIATLPRIDHPRQKSMDAATAAIRKEVLGIKAQERLADYDFFGFVGIRSGGYGIRQNIFWLPLERELGASLMKTDNSRVDGYMPLGQEGRLFLFCAKKDPESSPYPEADCLEQFKKDRPTYVIKKPIYADEYLSVYLTQTY